MAVLEQLVYGSRADDDLGRAVLGHSPGLIADCCQELVRLCEGWGAVPDDGLRRAVVLAFPLESRLPALPGELVTVIRISAGLRPVYHAVVLNSRDYQAFDHNPFALVQEGVFLDSWRPGQELARRTASPTALAPLVSPPPSSGDVGSIDEAVRQMLANHRLLLPLESPTSDSDRFLALVVAALPRSLRRSLRLASWAPSGANRYTLAATYKDNVHFAAWQPYLMTSIIGNLDATADEYLGDLRCCLNNGDLAGLERLSREARLDVGSTAGRSLRPKDRTLSATLDESSVRKLARQPVGRPGKPAPPVDSRKPRFLAAAAEPTRSISPAINASGRPSGAPPRKTTPHRRPRPRVQGSGRARRGFAVLLSLAILGAGAYYLWTAGHWTRLPGLAMVMSSLEARTDHGVVDVGAVYRAALVGVGEGHAGALASRQDNARRRGLDLLRQAGQLLEVQGQSYLQDGEQTLVGQTHERVSLAPADRLQPRGEVLARELRRLAMAKVALRDGQDWQDLADLDAQGLAARYDSLVARRRLPGTEEPDLVAIDHLLRRLDVTNRQIHGLARLEALLAQDQWADGWSREVRTAVDALGAVRRGRAHDLRDDADLLARLKQAEQRSALANLAYRGLDDQQVLTPAVADILPSVYRRVEARDRAASPALLTATADLYRGLTEAFGDTTAPARMAGLLPVLTRNRAHRFDPAAYGDHLARLRFRLVAQLVAARAPADSLITLLDSEQRVAEHLAFLSLMSRPSADAAAWRALADQLDDPFLRRWARHRLAGLDRDLEARLAELRASCEGLRTERAAFERLVASGGRGGDRWWQMSQAAARAQALLAAGGIPDAEAHLIEEVADQVAFLAAPPALSLDGVTVRLDDGLTDDPVDVVVEVQVARGEPRVTPTFRIGPAAPAGSGWVGAAEVGWTLPIQAGDAVRVTVRPSDGDRTLAEFRGRWLEQWDPRDLGSLASDQGVRISWRLERPYWDALEAPRR